MREELKREKKCSGIILNFKQLSQRVMKIKTFIHEQ